MKLTVGMIFFDTNRVVRSVVRSQGHGTVVLTLISERPRLCLPFMRSNEEVGLCVEGEIGRTYTVEVSSDLASWTPIASVVNTDGTLEIADPGSTYASQRFYRLTLEF